MEKNCCATDCDNDVSHSFGFPGESLQFICEEHRKGLAALTSPDFTRVATFTPIADHVDDAPRDAPLCTFKAHNAQHVRPAVLAYHWAEPSDNRGDGLHDGTACPGCVIELVRAGQQPGWQLELSELP